MKCNNCYYAKTNNCSTKGISFFGNDCEEFIDIYIADTLINQGRADERERIIKALKSQKATEEDDSLAESVSTAIWNKAISRAIGIVKRGGENE